VKRLSAVRRRIELQRGRASDFIGRFETNQPGEVVDLLVVVSNSEHNRDRTLRDSEAFLRRAVHQRGAAVGEVTHWKGGRYAGFKLPRPFRKAAWKAKAQGRKLLAESTDRFLRDPYYHSNDAPDRQVWRREDFEDLRDHFLDVPLVTYLDPDASPKAVRSFQRKRGKEMKGNPGGRCSKRRRGHRNCKAIKEQWLPIVQGLKDQGLNAHQIYRDLQTRGAVIVYRTVLRWFQGM